MQLFNELGILAGNPCLGILILIDLQAVSLSDAANNLFDNPSSDHGFHF